LKWVTREHPMVERVACPWLIKRFIDRKAEFIFVPSERVLEVAEKEGAIPFDVEGAELTHRGDRCSFDAIIEKYGIRDPAVLELAKIVRAADTEAKDLVPEGRGLEAVAQGSQMIVKDDHDALRRNKHLYDSLYAYCKLRIIKEKHKEKLSGMDRKQRYEFLRAEMKKPLR
jgi:hypothetical protein